MFTRSSRACYRFGACAESRQSWSSPWPRPPGGRSGIRPGSGLRVPCPRSGRGQRRVHRVAQHRRHTGRDLRLGGARLLVGSPGGETDRATIDAGVTLAANQTYLLANNTPRADTRERSSPIRPTATASATSRPRASPASPLQRADRGRRRRCTEQSLSRRDRPHHDGHQRRRVVRTHAATPGNNATDFASLTPSEPENFDMTVPADPAPSVTASDPANNAANVDRDANLHVTLSEPVKRVRRRVLALPAVARRSRSLTC